MMTAAAWSITLRPLRVSTPLARRSALGRDRAQPLVDQPDGDARAQPCGQAPRVRRRGLRRPALAVGKRTSAARRPPRRPRARPRARPGQPGRVRPRRSVTSGVASSPSGSQRATPTRTEPTSTPSRTPGPHRPASHAVRARRSRAAGDALADDVLDLPRRASSTREGSVPPPWATSSLPPPPPPSTWAASAPGRPP